MLEDFLKYIEGNRLVKPGERVLAAVSGGIDSMVMADLLLRTGLLSGIAHCNFHLRGKESDLDEALVRRYAAKHRIPFHSVSFSTKEHAREKGVSIEMAARELRYEWFEKICLENDYGHVAVAHNQNDNIETLLLNLVRGTGIAGLTGMKPSAGRIIRPMLFSPRKSIEKYGRENGIKFREDSTNADTKFIRNKIRHEVMPLLREINPSVETTLNETGQRLNGIYEIISDVVSAARNSAFRKDDGNVVVTIGKLKPFLSNQTFLFELFRPYGISGSLLDDLQDIIAGQTGGQVFTGTHRIIKNRDQIIITKNTEDKNGSVSFDSVSSLRKSEIIVSAKTETVGKDFSIPADPYTASFDFHKVSFPVVIRKWQPGDYFYPLGMTRRKKLSDYFIDRKLSRLRKEEISILESGGKIVWIIGERIDNRFRITTATKKALIIKAHSS